MWRQRGKVCSANRWWTLASDKDFLLLPISQQNSTKSSEVNLTANACQKPFLFLRESLLCPISIWSVPFLRTGCRRSSCVFVWSHLAQPFFWARSSTLCLKQKFFPHYPLCIEEIFRDAILPNLLECAIDCRSSIWSQEECEWLSFLLGCFIQRSLSAFWRGQDYCAVWHAEHKLGNLFH